MIYQIARCWSKRADHFPGILLFCSNLTCKSYNYRVKCLADIKYALRNQYSWRQTGKIWSLRKKCPHSELFWSKCWKIQTRITPNKDTFHSVDTTYVFYYIWRALVTLPGDFTLQKLKFDILKPFTSTKLSPKLKNHVLNVLQHITLDYFEFILHFCWSIGVLTEKHVKDALEGLRQFLITESSLKMMKNAFYFTLKALFVLKIFKFLSWLSGHVEKTARLER